MINKFKDKIKIWLDRIFMILYFYRDYRTYKKYNYNNPNVKMVAAKDSRLLRQTHIIEKGMSLSSPKVGFGQDKIKQLLSYLDEYKVLGYSTENFAYKNAITVLLEYQKQQEADANSMFPEFGKLVVDKLLRNELAQSLHHYTSPLNNFLRQFRTSARDG